MPKFIEVHNNVINVEDILRVEFISDDIYPGLFPRDKDGEIVCDFEVFTYAKIHTFSGSSYELTLDLFQPEDGECEEAWSRRNMVYIGLSMTALYGAIEDVVKVTGFEYQ